MRALPANHPLPTTQFIDTLHTLIAHRPTPTANTQVNLGGGKAGDAEKTAAAAGEAAKAAAGNTQEAAEEAAKVAAHNLAEIAGVITTLAKESLGDLLVHPGHATVGVYYLAMRHQVCVVV